MVKDIPSAVTTNIQQTVTTQAICVEIRRKDGRIYRMTDHTEDLTVDGGVFDASIPFDVGPIDSGSGMSADNTDLTLYADGTIFVLEHFEKRLFDNAEVLIFWVDYTTPSEGVMIARRGWFGEIKTNQNKKIDVTVVGALKLLDFKVVRTYQPLCDADFGDKRCKVAVDQNQGYDERNTYCVGDWVYKYDTSTMTALTVNNPSFDVQAANVAEGAAITNWTFVGTTAFRVRGSNGSLASTDGARMLVGGLDGGDDDNGFVSTMYQDIDVSSLSTNVDDGKITFALSYDAGSGDNIQSGVRVKAEGLDANGNVITFKDPDFEFFKTVNTWHGRWLVMPLIEGVRTVRIYISFVKIDSTFPAVCVDNLAAYYWDHTTTSPNSSVIQKMTNYFELNASNQKNLTNPSFDAQTSNVALANNPTITGWTVTGWAQTNTSVNGLTDQHGTRFLSHGDSGGGVQHETTVVQQKHLVNDWGLSGTAIDASELFAVFQCYAGWGDAGDSETDIEVEWFTEADASISTWTIRDQYNIGSIGWEQVQEGIAIPATARKATLTITLRSPAASALGTSSIDYVRFNVVSRTEVEQFQTVCGTGLGTATFGVSSGQITFDGNLIWEALSQHIDYDTVATVTDNKTFTVSTLALGDELYRGAKLIWLSGNNAGLKNIVRIWDQSGTSMKLYVDTPFDIQVGDRFLIETACHKRVQEDCKVKFNNVVNFRGMPYIPGRFAHETQADIVTTQSS